MNSIWENTDYRAAMQHAQNAATLASAGGSSTADQAVWAQVGTLWLSIATEIRAAAGARRPVMRGAGA